MEANPYSAPLPPDLAQSPFSSALSDGVIQQLAGTKPWVRFMSVLLFLGSGLLCLLGGAMVLASGFAASTASSTLPFNSGAIIFAMSAVYFVIAAFYIFPAIKLWKYANRISSLMYTRSDADLVAALKEQRVFWKFTAIAVIVMIGLYLVGILIFVTMGFATASHMRGL